MNVGNETKLVMLTKKLERDWEHTRTYWHDSQADHFEDRYLHDLFATVNTTMNAMQKLNKRLTLIRRNCE